MASLGVLSKTHRQGAIKLLGQSLGMELQERHEEIQKDKFIKELQSMAKASKEKQEELQQHIKEMEDMGYDLTEYKESLKGNIGGATREEVEAAKREALMNDRSMRTAKDAMAESVAVPDTAGMTPSQAYKAAQEAASGIDRHHEGAGSDEELDYDPNVTKPGCDHKCKLCYRTHCRWRNTNYED